MTCRDRLKGDSLTEARWNHCKLTYLQHDLRALPTGRKRAGPKSRFFVLTARFDFALLPADIWRKNVKKQKVLTRFYHFR